MGLPSTTAGNETTDLFVQFTQLVERTPLRLALLFLEREHIVADRRVCVPTLRAGSFSCAISFISVGLEMPSILAVFANE